MKTEELTVWLYGSNSRGDADTLSDVDIFVACNKEIPDAKLKSLLPMLPSNISTSTYKWSEVINMSKYGSLFLQHLRMEGSPLFESDSSKGRLANILSKASKYQHIARDIKGFFTVLEDVRESILNDGALAYELSVIATVIRHSAILGCWMSEKPEFGRTAPVVTFVQEHSLNPVIASEFPELYNYRLYIDDRIPSIKNPSLEMLYTWLTRADNIITTVKGLYDGIRKVS